MGGLESKDLWKNEAVYYDRLRRLIVECSYGRESIEAV